MNSKTFDRLFEEQTERSRTVLCGKAAEYAQDDERLHNFKVAAVLQDILPRQALAGMMAKHTISIYDMCWSGRDYPTELWEEKITDHINYLHLLNALIRENTVELPDKETVIREDFERFLYAQEIADRAIGNLREAVHAIIDKEDYEE